MSKDVAWAETIEERLGHPVQPPADTHSLDVTVRTARVREHRWDIEHDLDDGGPGGFSVLTDDLPWKLRDIEPPKSGDRMRVYLHHGWTTVGFDLRGERLFLRSEAEMNLRWLLFRARKEREDLRDAQI